MQISNVNAAASATGASQAAPVLTGKTLGQDDFLKLLMAQLGNQDPLQPVSNTEFVSQMAQFTALSQTSEMAGSLSRMEALGQMQGAAALLGREVTLVDGKVGVVREIQTEGGTHWLNLGDRLVTLDEVVSFRTPATPKRLTPSATPPPSAGATGGGWTGVLSRLPGAETLMGYIKSPFAAKSGL